MAKFVVATKNKGKLKEIAEILKGLPYEVISMEEMGISNDIEEYGTTFEENALIKAKEIAALTGELVMADDSGLEVDSLNGAPGIYSARYAGEGASDADRNRKLLTELKNVPQEKRSARFVAAIAVVFPDGRNFAVRGVCEGVIGVEPKGDHGFGYDPLFFMPEYGVTIAEMEPEQKNKVSHRANALRQMLERLKRMEGLVQ